MADLRALLRRLATPLSAALIFCGIGLTCAVGVISINRMLAQRPPPVAAALPSPPGRSSPTPSPAATTASPTPALTEVVHHGANGTRSRQWVGRDHRCHGSSRD